MFFPEARHAECSAGTAAGSIRGCWMLVGLLCEIVPQVPSNTPPSALHRFSLYPIQHVCFTHLLFQPSSSLNNYLSSSYFARFSPTAPSSVRPPLFWRTLPFFILSSFYSHPSTSRPYLLLFTLSLSYSRSTGAEEAAREA